MEKEGVNLARRLAHGAAEDLSQSLLCARYSGGGAVFQDLGCTTFTLLQKEDGTSSSSEIIDKNFELLTRALTKGVEIPAVRKGRNDIVLSADGRKISGNAFKQLPGSFVLHHGTILVNSDMSALGSSLVHGELPPPRYSIAYDHGSLLVREARDFGDPAHGMWNIYPTEELNIYTDASSIAFGAVLCIGRDRA
ncbi:hypothetical protein FOZ63_025832 [Perkinsus olseni]|uniref:BPL/LPL catalytic domain-containing protein n=1 Tax=Perkinsus olseni TaxID=32597 RepID=A0A7J6UFH2_PEROL|nr:hypothetical protein FOZ63_025832 [Perkinsus olseni]